MRWTGGRARHLIMEASHAIYGHRAPFCFNLAPMKPRKVLD